MGHNDKTTIFDHVKLSVEHFKHALHSRHTDTIRIYQR
jgi:hypothetical protein